MIRLDANVCSKKHSDCRGKLPFELTIERSLTGTLKLPLQKRGWVRDDKIETYLHQARMTHPTRDRKIDTKYPIQCINSKTFKNGPCENFKEEKEKRLTNEIALGSTSG